MLGRILDILFPVFAIAGIGYAYGRWKAPDLRVANQLNLEVFIPALIFWALASKPLALGEYTDLCIGGIAVILGSGLLLWPLTPWLKVQAKTFLPPMMFNNSGNMGIPVLLFAFGEPVMQAAVLLFVIEMVLHLTVGIYILDHRTRPWQLLRLPMILATIAGLVVGIQGWVIPAALLESLKMLGQISIPLLLFALGVRMNDVSLKDWRVGVAGALLCPLSGVLIYLLLRPWLDLSPLQASSLLVFAALPPAVMNYLISEQYRQEPQRVASIVMLGNLGSLLAVPLALYFAL